MKDQEESQSEIIVNSRLLGSLPPCGQQVTGFRSTVSRGEPNSMALERTLGPDALAGLPPVVGGWDRGGYPKPVSGQLASAAPGQTHLPSAWRRGSLRVSVRACFFFVRTLEPGTLKAGGRHFQNAVSDLMEGECRVSVLRPPLAPRQRPQALSAAERGAWAPSHSQPPSPASRWSAHL